MRESTSSRTSDVVDTYRITTQDVREPPTTFAGRLRYLGPGLLISASVVGSGELIATTALGAEVGFALLWLVLVSTGVKVWAQLELARWAIVTGDPALSGYSRIGRRFHGLGWINIVWLVMDTAKMLQRGGILGGVVAALSIMLPVIGEPLGTPSLVFWAVVVVAGVVTLLTTSGYAIIERVAVVIVVIFTAITACLAVALPFTDFGYTGADLASGLSFTVPVGALGAAIAMFGITGVGADEMTTYTYWVIEKGYARYTGPNDGSEERARRAEGWIRVMHVDLLVSWIISALCTISFYVIGAAILHPQGLVPEGNEMIVTLSRLYTDTLGEWSKWLFLVAAIAVLGSTFLTASASVPRLWTHSFALFGLLDWSDPVARGRVIKGLTIGFPILWALGFLVIQSPVVMVQIGGVASALFLVAVVVAVWNLRHREVPRRFRRNRILTVMLVISSIAIGLLALYTGLNVFGLT